MNAEVSESMMSMIANLVALGVVSRTSRYTPAASSVEMTLLVNVDFEDAFVNVEYSRKGSTHDLQLQRSAFAFRNTKHLLISSSKAGLMLAPLISSGC
jgi:hypothetical protein